MDYEWFAIINTVLLFLLVFFVYGIASNLQDVKISMESRLDNLAQKLDNLV